jgi:signal transduction histidine kinase
MAWQFADRQLAREAQRLAAAMTILAWMVALLIFSALTAGYFYFQINNQHKDLWSDCTRIQGEVSALSRLAQGDVLAKSDYRKVLFDTRSNSALGQNADAFYSMTDGEGGVLAQLGRLQPAPVIRSELQFAGEGANGTIAVERSLWPLIRATAFVALIALLLSSSVLLVLRILPVRSLYATMTRLDKSRQAQAQAERGLRAHLLELEKAKDALQASTNRLQVALEAAAEGSQAKSQFLATMSHELRTPLNAIIGFSEIMQNGLFGPLGNDRYGEYVSLILSSGRHLLSLVNEILDLSKAGAGKLELYDGEVDIALLVRDIVRTMQETAAKAEVKLVSAIPSGLPCLRADPQRITQVLLNLISNAIKFNIVNGTVRIEADCNSEDGFRISVHDSGIGIAADDIPKALERFGQVEDSFSRRYQGTGLGLPISKKLVELHGGTLMLKSVLGEGTTVTVWLPPERVITDRALVEEEGLGRIIYGAAETA